MSDELRQDELAFYREQLEFYTRIGAYYPERAARNWVVQMRDRRDGREARVDGVDDAGVENDSRIRRETARRVDARASMRERQRTLLLPNDVRNRLTPEERARPRGARPLVNSKLRTEGPR